ncbi:hypothetical protein MKX01_039499 [Papaver californicum]|nr:hypothetical protein MKX01_039499 [Papaver californicum]
MQKMKKKVTSRKLLSVPNTVAMKKSKATPDLLNSTVLGKKRRGETKHIGSSASRSNHKRNHTLLKELIASSKSSVFVDNRIGERNNQLGEFDKAILRRERHVLFAASLWLN